MAKREAKGITIIKKEEVVEGGHHGGAWKVAYADFVTAMMAFFLLMWLLNATTEQQRRGLADYFSPNSSLVSQHSGTGKPMGGQSPFEEGMAISDRGTVAVMNANSPPVDQDDDGSDTLASKTVHLDQMAGPGTASGGEAAGAARKAAEAARREEQAGFARVASEMQKAIAADPELAPIARQLAIDLTPEGLRVQIKDSEGQPMFATGSPEPNARAKTVLQKLTPMLMSLHEKVAIAGFTDAAPYAGPGRTNWELSADRANAARRILTEAGLPDDRIRDVTGHGDHDPLLPEDPQAAANRRIAILLVRSAPPMLVPAVLASPLPPPQMPASVAHGAPASGHAAAQPH
jgi:chemotaxis protein MotB